MFDSGATGELFYPRIIALPADQQYQRTRLVSRSSRNGVKFKICRPVETFGLRFGDRSGLSSRFAYVRPILVSMAG